jgi:hypothetical protein
MSADGLQKILRKGDTSLSTLEKIANVLEVPISAFFDDSGTSVNGSVTGRDIVSGHSVTVTGREWADTEKDREIGLLKELVAEKERLISILLNQINK